MDIEESTPKRSKNENTLENTSSSTCIPPDVREMDIKESTPKRSKNENTLENTSSSTCIPPDVRKMDIEESTPKRSKNENTLENTSSSTCIPPDIRVMDIEESTLNLTSSVAPHAVTTPLTTQVKHLLETKPLPSPSTSPVASDDKTDNRDRFFSQEARLKTFEKWPLSFLSPESLAQNGFYYLGRGDEVRCAFCKVEIMRWEEGDDPAKDHKRWAPQCPFLRNHSSAGNVPAESSAPTKSSALTNGRDECGVRPPAASICMPGPVHPQYASEAARLSSFKDWPRSMPQKPEDLAEAGFFYTGQGDKTKCYYCDGGLKDWEKDDIPWEEHARWFDRCAYVQLVKGKEYIQRVKTEACLINGDETGMSSASVPAPTTVTEPQEEEPIEDSKLCKICFNNERNVVFVPCGHVVACAKCALSTDKCPMCRRTFQNAIRLYYS